MKKKELLNEVMGVPKALTPWTNVITEIIIDYTKEELGHWFEYGETTYYDEELGEEVTEDSGRSEEVEIGGRELMRMVSEKSGFSDISDFLNSEMFSNFPLFQPKLKFIITGIPSKLYKQLDDKNLINASFETPLNLGLSKIGKKKVMSNCGFYFNVITDIEEITTKFRADLKSTISHELLHAYQKYQQLLGGKNPDFGKETLLNLLANLPHFKDLELSWWDEFLHLVYLHLSFEVNARIPQLYEFFKEKGVNTKESFLRELKKTNIWQEMIRLQNFDAEEYIKSFKIPEKSGGIDRETANPMEVLSAALSGKLEDNLTKLKNRGIDISSEENAIKSLINMWDTMLRMAGEHIKNETGVDFNMLPVPESAKKDPYLFFKFFEKRFHKKAKTWKKKLYRLASLLIQDGENTLQ
jgi:hypothetical protein